MRRMIILGVLSLLVTVAMACGGSAPTPTITPSPEPPTRPTTPPPPPPPSCESPSLEISVNGDALLFDNDRLEVGAASEVVLCFNNVSRSNQHNWVLVRAGTKDAVAKRGREAGPDNDWVQPGDPDVVAHTRLLDPGVASEVSFTAPPAGTYQFVCTFPGHNFTMSGEFVVTP